MAIAIVSGCGVGATSVPHSDASLVEMRKAMEKVDRASLGFTPIPADADMQLETGMRAPYDAMIKIYGATHRSIAFRKLADGYKWIFEQETHFGPKMYTDVDGTSQEHLVVEYQTERVNGPTLNQIQISYSGQDDRLAGRDDLTLEVIRPILDEWKGTPIR